MIEGSAYKKILTDETLRERVPHGNNEYPFSYYFEDIWLFDLHCIDWHWHPEVEFVYLKEGNATLQVGANQYCLTAGNGIFINSQVIHRFNAEDHAIIPNIVFSPFLLAGQESLIYTKYIYPIIKSSVECVVFSADVEWQSDIIKMLLQVFEAQENDKDKEIDTVQKLLGIWNVLYRHINLLHNDPVMPSHIHAQLQVMMQYIHTNYQDKISLDDIAETVSLSKSSVLKIFNDNLGISPVNYLIRYRLRCAAKLLNATEDSVSDIALNTGFENIGYFCRKFKGLYGMTPSEYRSAGRLVFMRQSDVK